METSAVGSDELRSRWLTSSVSMIKKLRGEGVPVVYDSVGKDTFQGSLDSLRRSGTFAWYGPVLGAPDPRRGPGPS